MTQSSTSAPSPMGNAHSHERRRCLDCHVLSLYHGSCLTSSYCSCTRICIRIFMALRVPCLPIRVPYLLSALYGRPADPNSTFAFSKSNVTCIPPFFIFSSHLACLNCFINFYMNSSFFVHHSFSSNFVNFYKLLFLYSDRRVRG